MECQLVETSSDANRIFNVREGAVTVGRDADNDIQLVSQYVSRHHAKITNFSSTCEIEDLSSANGTFVNGARITRAALKHDDEVRFGDLVFKFRTAASGADDAEAQERNYSPIAQQATLKIKPLPGGPPLNVNQTQKPQQERIPLRYLRKAP